jgi:cyclopropane fatty-acyl-phospholipid synthase-like methyltransferase
MIREGIGIDINSGFLRIAKRLAARSGAENISFQLYDRDNFRPPAGLELIISVGVFERLTKGEVGNYVSWFRQMVRGGGRVGLYFLAESATQTEFVRRLGPEAYFFWNPAEIRELMCSCDFRTDQVLPWGSSALLCTGTAIRESNPGATTFL